MKKIFFLIAAFIAITIGANAQCPVKVKYRSASMEVLDASMTVKGSQDVPVTLVLSDKTLEGVKNDLDSLHGTVKSVRCNWKEPYKNGKVIMVCDVKTPDEDLRDVTVTIEAVDGKLTILLVAKEHPDEWIRLAIDRYEEIK